jgi:Domain of unknown function (DUF5658)
MSFPQQALLLFLLNFFDAVLTIFWIRNGYATEGNHLMATLLDIGDSPFLAVKLAIGAVTAFVLWRWKDVKIAKYGLMLSLAIYIGLMAIHFITGLSAAGLLSETFLVDVSIWTNDMLA